jgi:hypothetical protein
VARKTKFDESLKETMLELYRKGKTDAEVADIVGVCEKTINNWKGRHPKFLEALKESKEIADELVEASLFSRAVGYSHADVKVITSFGNIEIVPCTKYYPPDTTAAIFWLKNRQPERWREKMPGEGDINITVTLAERVARARNRAGKNQNGSGE